MRVTAAQNFAAQHTGQLHVIRKNGSSGHFLRPVQAGLAFTDDVQVYLFATAQLTFEPGPATAAIGRTDLGLSYRFSLSCPALTPEFDDRCVSPLSP